MSSEMIERVAKALAKSNCTTDWDYYIGSAKAAIEAMREPTKEILNVKTASIYYSSDQIWQDMIDAALKE